MWACQSLQLRDLPSSEKAIFMAILGALMNFTWKLHRGRIAPNMIFAGQLPQQSHIAEAGRV